MQAERDRPVALEPAVPADWPLAAPVNPAGLHRCRRHPKIGGMAAAFLAPHRRLRGLGLVLLGLVLGLTIGTRKSAASEAGSPRLDPEVRLEMGLGWRCYSNADYGRSLAHYRKAIAAAPGSIEARLGCLLPLLALGRFVEAETGARQILEDHPANYTARLRLAYALRRQGRTEEAEALLRSLQQEYPSDPAVLLELAWVELARQRTGAAHDLVHEALLLDPENAAARSQLLAIESGAADGLSGSAPAGVGGGMDSGRFTGQSRSWALNAMTYFGWVNYRQTASKDQAYMAGLYADLGYGRAHRLEAEVDSLDLHYRDYPSLEQRETTVVYANSSLPGLRFRAGVHAVFGEDPLTDRGWTAFGGLLYRPGERWEIGLDGYRSEYPDYPGGLDVGQIVPRFGLTLWRGTRHRWSNDLRGYWIGPSRDLGLGSDLGSVEDRIALDWGAWRFSVQGWVGRQVFALRNDGFTAFNLLEDHVGGFGFEVRHDLSSHVGFTLRLSREFFEEFGTSTQSTADSVLAMLGLRF